MFYALAKHIFFVSMPWHQMKTPGNSVIKFAVVVSALFVGFLGIQPAQAGIWITNGLMNTARYGHTATLLPNGRVLATGGGYNAGYFSSTELYNSTTRSWTAAGSMSINRVYHTATLLLNGKVLVVGGLTSAGLGNSPNNRADLYDPATGSWSATGSMATARYSHTATSLPNGKVLVTGGNKGGSSDSTAELYDPATGTWTSAGAMTVARSQHTATLLPNGKVLIAGGVGLSTAELYDPGSGVWTATGSMTSSRRLHTATLLSNGKVLIAGGINSGSATLSSAETYDPTSGTWTAVGAMLTARFSHTATLLPNGKVLVAGGNVATSSFTGSTELYAPGTGTWSAAGVLGVARGEHSATLLSDGRILAAGGRNRIGNSIEATSSTELYVKAPATVSLDNLVQTYDGTAKHVSFTTTPLGLAVDLTCDGSLNAPTNAGTYTVVGTINDLDYEGGVTNTLKVSKAAGTVTLGNLIQTYDGTAKSVSFTTTPPGMTVAVTYAGSINAPTNPGTYTVVGTIDNPNYFGSTTNTLLVGIGPIIQSQPTSRTNNLGTTATFLVVADGTPPLSYQWRKDGIDCTGGNGPTLILTNVQKNDEGIYSVAISNAFGGVVSADARLSVNLPPVADATATLPLIISVNGSNATVVLDASKSHDPDGDCLQYTWFDTGSTNVLTNGVVAVVVLPLGTNTITLTVSDGLATDSQTITVEVLTYAQAINRLIDVAEDDAAKKSLLATLRAALAAIDRNSSTAALNQLQAFQNQVNAQIGPIDPVMAQTLINEAQFIIDAITGGTASLGKIKIAMNPNGKLHLNFSGMPGKCYVIEASTDFVNWEKIGVAQEQNNEDFMFDDNIVPNATARYYRVTAP